MSVGETTPGVQESPDLSVVIPMHNAGKTIGKVVSDFLAIDGVNVEILVVDDASTDDSVAQVEKLADPRARVIHSPGPRGAGVARNHGFPQARGTYTLFFDADDEIHPAALVAALDTLEGTEADLAFLPYRYRRAHDLGYLSMNSFDLKVWSKDAAKFLGTVERQAKATTLAKVPQLLGFTNYPWNKVMRTERYREAGLKFGHTPVHNDVLGHWMGLLEARSIVLIDEPLCTHIVVQQAGNLTNRRDRTRLTLFDALDETYDYLRRRPHLRRRYAHHYWDFAMRCATWARGRIAAEYRPEFDVRLQQHLLQMDLSDFARIRQHHDPELATRIVQAATS
jgi:glycosyltransferase involved in cell wall biosynthesis